MSVEDDRLSWLVRLGVAAFGAVLLYLLILASSLRVDGRGFGTHEQLGLSPCWVKEEYHIPALLAE